MVGINIQSQIYIFCYCQVHFCLGWFKDFLLSLLDFLLLFSLFRIPPFFPIWNLRVTSFVKQDIVKTKPLSLKTTNWLFILSDTRNRNVQYKYDWAKKDCITNRIRLDMCNMCLVNLIVSWECWTLFTGSFLDSHPPVGIFC